MEEEKERSHSKIVANVVNIGADLGGMAEATGMVTGTRAFIWRPIIGESQSARPNGLVGPPQ
jgi:hypothetical protein